jgi:hypothetical protein
MPGNVTKTAVASCAKYKVKKYQENVVFLFHFVPEKFADPAFCEIISKSKRTDESRLR